MRGASVFRVRFCDTTRRMNEFAGESIPYLSIGPAGTAILDRDSEFPGETARMTRSKRQSWMQLCLILTILLLATTAFGQDPPPGAGAAPQVPPTTYTPKFKGDPARSDSEAAALAYMRVVIRAEKQFNKQYSHYALTLAELVHSGSFTKRMVNTDRGDYVANYKGKKDSYILTMTPKNLDPQHRSFYAEDDGKIHGEETKPAGPDSPIVK